MITAPTAQTIETLNASLDGSGFHVTEEGVICKGARFMGMHVVTARANQARVQVRHVVSDRLYWSGSAANIRSFTRDFWASA